MTKKRKLLIITVVSIIVILTCVIVLTKYKSNNKQPNHKTELYNKVNDLIISLVNTEAYEYIDSNFLDTASDITLTTTLEKFSSAPDYENLSLEANIRKNKDNSHLTTDIRTSYKGIQLISGKFEYKDTKFKFYSPKIYNKVISGDFDLIKNSAQILFSNNTLIQVTEEFFAMYPDEAKEISQNIHIAKDNSGYNFTIKADAVKTLLKCTKEFIFEGNTCKSLWSDYITSEYYSNPNNSEYYTLEEYKEQYIKSNKPFIQATFDIAADLINFDITIHFATDSKGNITSIKYSDGNSDIGGIIDLDITPYKNTYNMEGYLSLMLAENDYRLDISHENKKKNDIFLTTTRNDITINANKYISINIQSSLDSNTDTQDIHFNFNGPDSEIALLCKAQYKPLDGNIISIKKEEINLSDMNIFELSKFLREIQENFNNEVLYALP